jgi:hypothetical protein
VGARHSARVFCGGGQRRERKTLKPTTTHAHCNHLATLSSYRVQAIVTLLPLTEHETLDEEQCKEALGNHRLAYMREQVGAEACCVSASMF